MPAVRVSDSLTTTATLGGETETIFFQTKNSLYLYIYYNLGLSI